MSTPLLDNITQQFINSIAHNGHLLEEQAKRVFYYLALVQLSISGVWMAISGESLLQSLTQLIKTALLLSVFYAGITLAQDWFPSLINGFIQLGQQSGVSSIHPSAILNQGLLISSTMLESLGGWGMLNHPFVSLVGVVVCVGIPLVYALIAAELCIVLIKAYLMISLSSLFFAFGASDWTRTMAVNYIKSVLSLGLQLMSLYFLIGVGQTLGNQWATVTKQASQNHELFPMVAILATTLIFYLIVKNVPPFVAGLSSIGGFRRSGDMAVGMAAAAVSRSSNMVTGLAGKMGVGAASPATAIAQTLEPASMEAIKETALSQKKPFFNS